MDTRAQRKPLFLKGGTYLGVVGGSGVYPGPRFCPTPSLCALVCNEFGLRQVGTDKGEKLLTKTRGKTAEKRRFSWRLPVDEIEDIVWDTSLKTC